MAKAGHCLSQQLIHVCDAALSSNGEPGMTWLKESKIQNLKSRSRRLPFLQGIRSASGNAVSSSSIPGEDVIARSGSQADETSSLSVQSSTSSETKSRTTKGNVGNGRAIKAVQNENKYASAFGELAKIDPGPSVIEYMEQIGFFLQAGDRGPPRFFCPIDAKPDPDFEGTLPRLLFLPGIEGTGYGLKLQHKYLSKIFEVSSLHVPLDDRTDFEGLVQIVVRELEEANRQDPKRALFLMGESFGGVLSLAAAARVPHLPITLVLINPATSFPQSALQPLIPFLLQIPPPLYRAVPPLLNSILGNAVKMAQSGIPFSLNPLERVLHLRDNLLNLLPTLPTLADILPQETLNWKIKLLKQGSAVTTDSLLSSIKFPTLVLASGEDNMLPSSEEADRLRAVMTSTKCIVRKFSDSGHTLLLEGDFDVASVIKASTIYRKSSKREGAIERFVPPTVEEFARATSGTNGLLRSLCSPVFFSTDDIGRRMLGLDALPGRDEQPLLFVGNHQTYAPDLGIIVAELLAKKGILLRGLTHPMALGMFDGETGGGAGMSDQFRLFGAVQVSGANAYKLMQQNEAVLLFPGGAREALKNRGEDYKLFWPDRAEFVRMAIKFGAIIIPFAAVGADDGYNFVLDGNEILENPFLGQQARDFQEKVPRVRDESAGAAAESFVAPIVLPKQINRLYFLFQKPIRTKGMRHLIDDKEMVGELYKKVKEEVEEGLEYLLRKRNEDPFKDLGARLLYEASWGGKRPAPTFKP